MVSHQTSETAAEMRKAEPQQPAASLQLSQDLVAQFGGITQVVAHFKAAPTAEASRNLLVIILDYAASSLAQVHNTVNSLCNDCFGYQAICPYIELT